MKRFLNATVIPASTRLHLLERVSFHQEDIIEDKYTGQTGELLRDLYLLEQYPDLENLEGEIQPDDTNNIIDNKLMVISFNLQILYGTKMLITSMIKGVTQDGANVNVFTINSLYKFKVIPDLGIH